jgi:DNA polymerase-1
MTQNTPKDHKTLLLLDGNAIVHRAYHAIPPLTTDDGTQTNAVYGFTLTLLNVLEKFHPDYIIVAFDPPGKTFRHEMFPEYKGKRKETPEDLVPQFDLVKKVVQSFGMMAVEQDGFEADDVIGTIAKQVEDDGVKTIIVTGDKDTLQLIDDHISVFTMSRGIHDMVLYDSQTVRDKMGIDVEQVVDYKGLRGDASDNIPGVKGIGEKTATQLLSEYHDLDHIYEHLDDIKDSVRKKLIADKQAAYLSRQLGTILTTVSIDPVDITRASVRDMTFDEARTLFHSLGFSSLMKRLPGEDRSQYNENQDAYVSTIVPEDEIREVFMKLSQKEVAIAVDQTNNEIYGVACATDDHVYYIPHTSKTKEICVQFLSNTIHTKIVYDLKTMKHDVSFDINGVKTDVLLQAYVVQQNKKFDLNALVFDVTGIALSVEKKDKQMSLVLRDHDSAVSETCKRAYYTRVLYEHFAQKIDDIIKSQKENANIKTILEIIEMPLIDVLYGMEKKGVAIDPKCFSRIAHLFDAEIDTLTQEIYAHAGETFNINSTQQLRVILFDKLQINVENIKKTKTGYSTASSELQKIRDQHPIVVAIERYRELFKLKTTYVDVLPTLADEDDRIHTTYNQAVATTGRLSSSDPNLQNIPIRTEDGRRLREGFVAKKGYEFVSADYSQIDLRCVAHVSNDPAMITAFQENVDIHAYTAAQVLDMDIADVTKDQRRSAKELNFGLIYGMGQYGFARAAHIDAAEAKKFIAAYFEKFSGIKTYMERIKNEAAHNGYVETLFGRRRYIPEITSKNYQLRSAGERAAINMPVQGLAADIMKLAMIETDRFIAKTYASDQVYAVLQVHDEIIFEARSDIAEQFGIAIRRVMENIYDLRVPLVVDIERGQRWSDL